MRVTIAIALLLAGLVQRGHADAGWLESGDLVLRDDLQLLNDAEVIRLPVAQWPIPRASVRFALVNAKEHFATNAAVVAALDRVNSRVNGARRTWQLDVSLSGGEPGLLRDFDSLGREPGELRGRVTYSGSDRAQVSLATTAAVDPQDDQAIRLDGSHATVQVGNWLLAVHALDRWWGPGHDGSLILSNNARAMPTFMVERATAVPFESRFLRWLGPWRFSFGISRMENERADIDAPLFMAWRVSVMPFKDIELGLSRTAQFCGKQLVCNLNSFANMLVGNDNVGIDTTAENEPGNQMAGFDIRWSSPIGTGPYAVYGQMIGEDESSYLPAKYLAQFGIEAWHPFPSGARLQAFAEFAATTCSAVSGSGPYYNCAYNQGQFRVEGYRYRGRVVGHTTDQDSESYVLGTTYTAANGDLWGLTARTARLNHDSVIDFRNTISPVPTDYDALEFTWRGRLLGQHLSLELGVESVEPLGAERGVDPYGFLTWRYSFSP